MKALSRDNSPGFSRKTTCSAGCEGKVDPQRHLLVCLMHYTESERRQGTAEHF